MSLTEPGAHQLALLSGQQVPQVFLTLSPVLRSQDCAATAVFYFGIRDPNSDPQACTESTCLLCCLSNLFLFIFRQYFSLSCPGRP